MLPFIIRRLLIAVPLLFVSSFLVFVMVANAGEPLPVENARLNPRTSEAEVRRLERQFNLDEPIVSRYWDWLTNALHGDFGEDNEGQSVFPQIRHALSITMRLVIVAEVIAVMIAVMVGVIGALRQYSIFDYTTTFSAFIFFSLPVFWLAVLLKNYAAIDLNRWLNDTGLYDGTLLYTVGHQSIDLPNSFFGRLGDYAGHMILPVTTLALISFAQYSRYTRSSMLEVLNSDYVRTAKAKGARQSRVVFRHALRNALIPLTTIIAINFGAVLGGAIITERVFQWRGMGTTLIEGITRFDVYMVQGWLMITAIIVVLFNLVADILYAYLDPRIRL